MKNDAARERVDVRIDSPAREGPARTTPGRASLAGTTPSGVYRPLQDAEQVTIAPDWRPMDEQPAWRTDFPIDWPQDHYLERGVFMKFMGLPSLAFVVGQLWIAAESWLRRLRGEPGLVRLAAVVDLPV